MVTSVRADSKSNSKYGVNNMFDNRFWFVMAFTIHCVNEAWRLTKSTLRMMANSARS